MRLSRPEFLLLPLFLLPLVAAVGLGLYAKRSYEAERDSWTRARVQQVAADPAGPAGEWPWEFESRTNETSGALPFRLDGQLAWARFARVQLDQGSWRFTTTYPGGVTARALASPTVRLALETGATRAPDGEFAALLAKADLPRLRRATLPAGTKRFLAARWSLAPALAAEIAELCGAVAHADHALPLGVHPRGEWTVVMNGRGPVVAKPAPTFAYAARVGDFELRYNSGGDAVWRGRLEQPLAGEWSVHALRSSWLDSSLMRRWGAPVGAGLALFLLLPAALWISLRKQRRLDEARARFITELAHDLRTPLTSVRMHAEMLAAGRGREHYADVVARESTRLSGLLANLLDLSRLDRGGRAFDLQPLELADVVGTAVRDFEALYPDRTVAVDVAGVRVIADRTALERCLANLLDNAGKFTPSGSSIRIDWQDGALRVTDSGPGVAPGTRLFERYARGAAAKRDGVPGTGMGLALVRELAEGMGGSVAYEAAEPGARFVLRLKRA